MPVISAATTTAEKVRQPPTRLLSLDVLRGIIMILLIGEGCLLYESLYYLDMPGTRRLVRQFFHNPWHGLNLYDLGQPAFMTVVGAAMYVSYYTKKQRGISWEKLTRHIVIRCGRLFILGIALHCVYAGKLVWELWNVLTQLAFTSMIAWFIISRSFVFQLSISVMLLLLTEILYRTISIPGFDQPFTAHKNFGAWFDTILMGKTNEEGWVAINFIPTAAHTIWGVLAGKVLMQHIPVGKKLRFLITGGITGLLIGYGLDWLHITPIIKHISTSSFVLVSGGWVLLLLAFIYWITDIKRFTKYAWIFTVVGMNAIFIYLFCETVGNQWLNETIGIFVKGGAGRIGIGPLWQTFLNALVTLFVEWYICYWLFKRKIFFKL